MHASRKMSFKYVCFCVCVCVCVCGWVCGCVCCVVYEYTPTHSLRSCVCTCIIDNGEGTVAGCCEIKHVPHANDPNPCGRYCRLDCRDFTCGRNKGTRSFHCRKFVCFNVRLAHKQTRMLSKRNFRSFKLSNFFRGIDIHSRLDTGI